MPPADPHSAQPPEWLEAAARVPRRHNDSRRRMLGGAAELLCRYGATATTIDRVVAAGGAPRGSVYYHFPRGRKQLVEEAVALAADRVDRNIRGLAELENPTAAVDAYLAQWRERLLGSDFRAGCPVVAVAVETNDDAPELARSAGAAFGRWRESLTALLVQHGLEGKRARRLSGFVIAAAEGAVILCRAERSIEPLDDAAAEIRVLLTSALTASLGAGAGTGPGPSREPVEPRAAETRPLPSAD